MLSVNSNGPRPRSNHRATCLGALVLSLVLAGCGEDHVPQPQHEFEGSTHVIAPQSNYFLAIPESDDAAATSAEAADGQFAAGTKVKIIEKSEKYIKVETFDGTQGYVPIKAVKENTPEG